MDQKRIAEISREMCDLLEQQRVLLRKGPLPNLSGEELVGYTQRNDRLRQLSKELQEVA